MQHCPTSRLDGIRRGVKVPVQLVKLKELVAIFRKGCGCVCKTEACTVHGFEAPDGVSVMQAATGYGVPGILAECGGSAICATCHVIVDDAWIDRLPAPLANELEMLECTASERLPGSRLSCQIQLNPALQGLVLRLPERQV